jgi:hypothetical protein
MTAERRMIVIDMDCIWRPQFTPEEFDLLIDAAMIGLDGSDDDLGSAASRSLLLSKLSGMKFLFHAVSRK